MRSLKPNNVADSVGGAVEVKGAELRVDGDWRREHSPMRACVRASAW